MLPVFRTHYQTAYVTTDREQALKLFADRYGVTEWYRPDPFDLQTLKGESYRLSVAHAFVGETNIEVIQPVSGADVLYRDILPTTGFGLRFHHRAFRIFSDAEWDTTRESGLAAGHTICWQGSAVGTKVLYFDTFAEIGHYAEYLYFFDIAKSSFPKIPHNPPRAGLG